MNLAATAFVALTQHLRFGAHGARGATAGVGMAAWLAVCAELPFFGTGRGALVFPAEAPVPAGAAIFRRLPNTGPHITMK